MTGMQTIARVGDATLSNDGSIVYFESLCGITHVIIFSINVIKLYNPFVITT